MKAEVHRQVVPFNLDWQFSRLSAKTPDELPAHVSWRQVRLPHDYSIESDFVAESRASSQKPKDLTVGELGLHLGSRSTGYLPGGPAWYQKVFTVPTEYAGKKVQILFDGVYMYSDVYINGTLLGHHHYGYTAFWYDLTPHLKIGAPNTFLVRTDNKLESRWYGGSGIYRPVHLVVTDKLHIPVWGTYVSTKQAEDGSSAEVSIETRVRNDGDKRLDMELLSAIVDADGKEVARMSEKLPIAPGQNVTVRQRGTVDKPALWAIETPTLYRVVSRVIADGDVVDDKGTSFGIRSLRFDAREGFLLNGVHTRLKGVCIHHDHGLLGAESYTWAEERKITKLKETGCNAIRCAHNPPSQEFLDACDRLGMLVIDESFDEWKRTNGKANGYSPVFDKSWKIDMESLLLRDRNHPSIIMWSIGNEVPDQGTDEGPALAKMLADYTRGMDPTRPVTVAVQPGFEQWGNKFPSPEFFAPVDICGYNYEALSIKLGGDFIENHAKFPGRIMYQSESAMRMFFRDWMRITDTRYILGDFVWTGIDYLGEVGCGKDKDDQEAFPTYMAMCGDLDITHFRKPRSYYRELLWNREPTVYMTVQRPGSEYQSAKPNLWGWTPTVTTWTWDEEPGTELTVDVYSGCEEVELFLNGKSLGTKKTSRATEFIASWHVPYHPGELKAVGYKDGNAVDGHVLRSASKPAKLTLAADRASIRADGNDISYITVEVTGGNGVMNPLADHEISFTVSGPATVAAVGNSSPYAPLDYPFHGSKCRTFEGRAVLIVRSTPDAGTIKIKATANGLDAGEVAIVSK